MSRRNHPRVNTRERMTRDDIIQNEIRSLRTQIAVELSSQRTLASGVDPFGPTTFASGQTGSLGRINEEYVPELKGTHQRIQVFDRMVNDPHVRGQIRSIAMTLVSGVRWQVEDGTQEQQDLVGANILRMGPPKWWASSSFYDRLNEGLGMLVHGFSAFALTRAMVEDTMIYQHIKWLHPRSIDENGWWMDENDNLQYITRSFIDSMGKGWSRAPIPVEDLFLMSWDRRGPNWQGNAFIRPMYKPWKFTEIAEKIDIIDLQNRGVAIPVAHLSGAGGPKERDTLLNILRTLRGGNKDQAFLVLEKDETVDYLTASGTPKDASAIIREHHGGIAKVGAGEYSETGSGGGRASASVLATGFYINVDAIRILVQDMMNFGCGPMPGLSESLQNANFDTTKKGFRYAVISGSRVSPTEQFDNIPLIQDAIKAGMIPPTLKYANETARRLGWPELTKQEFDEGMQLLGKGQQPMGAPTQAGPDLNPTRGDQLSKLAPEPGRAPIAKGAITAYNESHDAAGRFAESDGAPGGTRQASPSRRPGTLKSLDDLNVRQEKMTTKWTEAEAGWEKLRDPRSDPGREMGDLLQSMPLRPGTYYRGMLLSASDVEKMSKEGDFVTALHSSMSRSQSLAEDYTTSMNMTKEEITNIRKNVDAATWAKIAPMYKQTGADAEKWHTLIRIQSKSARDISPFSDHDNEKESVMLAGTRYTSKVTYRNLSERRLEIRWTER